MFLWHESLLSSFLLHQRLCKHRQSLPCEGAKSFREVLGEPVCVGRVNLFQVQEEEEGEDLRFEGWFYVSLEEMRLFGNFQVAEEGLGILKQWKMDDFQRGRGVFALSVVSLSGPLLCQEGARKGPNCPFNGADGEAKNTPLNTRPLFTCLLTPPDLFTGPSQAKQKTHLAENTTYVIIRQA